MYSNPLRLDLFNLSKELMCDILYGLENCTFTYEGFEYTSVLRNKVLVDVKPFTTKSKI